MAKWNAFYKIVQQATATEKLTDNQDVTGGYGYGNYTWYHRLVQ